jgi:hypothetical protein
MKNEVFVVLGMHKSGTTLVSDMLHRSGIPMVEAKSTEGYDEGNKMERHSTRMLNMDLLAENGVESLRLVRALDPGDVTAAHREKALSICREANEAASGSSWGFKDPRTLLTFEFWLDILENPRPIGVFRDPLEVFQHYVRRAGRRWISRDPAYLPDALHSWCVYNQRLLNMKDLYPEMILLNYSQFMTSEDALSYFAKYVGCQLVDCRDLSMRRAKSDRTTDYRIARQIVRLRNKTDPDQLYSELCRNSEFSKINLQ